MSLLEPYRKLREENQKLLEENEILLQEIRALKNIMYGLQLDLGKKKKKNKLNYLQNK